MSDMKVGNKAIKLMGVNYRRSSPASLTGADGEFHCPKCDALGTLSFVDEDTQLGFWFNKYFEFLQCTVCKHNVVSIVNRKRDDHIDV